MTLFQAWRDSVSLLKPKNLKLFVLVTLKSIIDTYKVLFFYWWWLLVIIIGCFIEPYIWAMNSVTYAYLEIISFFAYQMLLFACLLATRPSLMPKDCAYFRSHTVYFAPIALILAFFPMLVWPNSLSLLYLLMVLFFLDSDKKILSKDWLLALWNSFIMFIYNYPLFFIVGIFFYAPVYCFYSYVYLTLLMANIIGALLIPIAVCAYTNIYIKKLHDQFDLYFKQPK